MAARDHTVAELRARLQGAGAPDVIVADTLARLVRFGYLDDARLARHTAADAVRGGYGRDRVRATLAARGVDETVIAAALADTPADEHAVALALLQRKFGTLPASARERARAARFLLRRGFPEPVVLAIVGEGC